MISMARASDSSKIVEEDTKDFVTANVEVTGTLRQGAARCMISNGTVRPLAATWDLASV